MSLYQKYRPTDLEEVVGQVEAVKVLQAKLKAETLPRALLFTGPSGCGKTSLARILRVKVGCSDSDFTEINCADFRGIDTVREIRNRMTLAPMGGKCRVWLLDEVHQTTKEAQSGLLKMLEDTPSHVYFMLCTTDPHKLLATVKTRCTQITCKSLTFKDLNKLLLSVCKKEKLTLPEEVLSKIIEASDGSARKALVILDQVSSTGCDEEALSIIDSCRAEKEAIELCRCLINSKSRWSDVAKIIKDLKEEPETLRRMVLGYASSCLLGSDVKRGKAFFLILTCFESHFYDSGKAGLVRACFEVFEQRG